MIKTDTIHISLDLLALLSEIDEFKGAASGALAPDRLHALRRVATIESIGSSTRFEGSKLSDREVEKILGKLEIKRFDTRDEQEVAGDERHRGKYKTLRNDVGALRWWAIHLVRAFMK